MPGSFVPRGRYQAGFEVGDYHPGFPVIIDPVLEYSTYLGSSSWDEGYGIAVDSDGCAYVTGITYSDNFPTVNPCQGALAGSTDAFVSKFSIQGIQVRELLFGELFEIK